MTVGVANRLVAEGFAVRNPAGKKIFSLNKKSKWSAALKTGFFPEGKVAGV